MIKCECPECGALWRMTAKVLAMCEHGMHCPACGGTDARADQ
jgi:Zn finger protein HypA/HybF involved in hydrogenase expression